MSGGFMQKVIRGILILVNILVFAPSLTAQGVGEAWVARYNGPGNFTDFAFALAIDDSGNIYVTGQSIGSGSDYDYATIKYYAYGDTAWVRRYNGEANSGDAANALAVDGSGNVYVTGLSIGSGSSYDYATIKYLPNGDTAWVRRYNGPGNSGDLALALAVDDSGNVYVTGYSFGSGSDADYATIKYLPNGDSAWVRRYNGPGNSGDLALALAVDDSGNVYVTGYSADISSGYDYATIKYKPDGDSAWVRRYNGPGDSADNATALAVDDSGNVYVTGYSADISSGYDYATIKYLPNGDSAWVRRYNGPGDSSDYATALAVDGSGNVYVTGQSVGSGSNYDYATIKYAPCSAKPGDANASGTYSLSDVIAIVNYIFNKPGCAPLPLCWLTELLCRGDWNGSNAVSLSDVIQAVNFIFNKPGGPWNPLPSGLCCIPFNP
jgi:hypothetical protein